MPRTPWREAIDGKIAVLRGLRSRTGHLSMMSYFYEADSYQGLPPAEKRRRAERSALTSTRMLSERVTNAEPYSLTYDIQEAITRTINLIGHETPPLAAQAMARTFVRTNLPSPNGFVWLDHPVAVAIGSYQVEHAAPGTETGGGALDSDGDRIACVLRAILYTPAYQTEPGVYAVGTDAPPPASQPVRHGLSMTAFLDLDAHPQANPWAFDRALTDGQRAQGLMPLVLPYLMEGDTLEQHMEALLQRYGSSLVDQTSHGFPTMFLHVLFEMMQQKIVLWGGSGLERDARKTAERNGLTPIVQVVTWRKAEYRYPSGHLPGKIDWTCRWPVKEHVRRLKNPDGSIRKSVVIQSYVKGPHGKPLKNPNQRVNLVRR